LLSALNLDNIVYEVTEGMALTAFAASHSCRQQPGDLMRGLYREREEFARGCRQMNAVPRRRESLDPMKYNLGKAGH
jgi:hypothetical protein